MPRLLPRVGDGGQDSRYRQVKLVDYRAIGLDRPQIPSWLALWHDVQRGMGDGIEI